ncbi:hypothetical protein ACQR16_17230 [Bradyrhizobium oligotrophicum]|uniref:hypothetical protein n=1 Tax=Bradyrhizobium oligotrophicum TaxID=44255 RepID=UPI003EBFE491
MEDGQRDGAVEISNLGAANPAEDLDRSRGHADAHVAAARNCAGSEAQRAVQEVEKFQIGLTWAAIIEFAQRQARIVPELKHAAVLEDEAGAAVAIGLDDVTLPQRVSIVKCDLDAVADDDHVSFGFDNASNDLRGEMRRDLSGHILAAGERNEPVVTACCIGGRPGRRLLSPRRAAHGVDRPDRIRLTLVRASMDGIDQGSRVGKRAGLAG